MEESFNTTYKELRDELLQLERHVRDINNAHHDNELKNESVLENVMNKRSDSIAENDDDDQDDDGRGEVYANKSSINNVHVNDNLKLDAVISELRTLHERCDKTLSDKVDAEEEEIENMNSDAEMYEDKIRELEQEIRKHKTCAMVQDILTVAPLGREGLCETVLTEMAELNAHLQVASCVFTSILSTNVEKISEAQCCAADINFATQQSWRTHERYLLKLMKELTRKTTLLFSAKLSVTSQQLPPPQPELVMLNRLQNELTKVQDLSTAALAHIERSERLRTQRDKIIDDFVDECDKLIVWCRQQQANLDAMKEPDHIQEYCGSLVENYTAMSQNFRILLSSVEELVHAHNTRVCDVLTKANELWFYLQTSAFERLAKTLYEIHPSSPLEIETNKYADTPHKLIKFIQSSTALSETVQNMSFTLSESVSSLDTSSLLLQEKEMKCLLEQFTLLNKEEEEWYETLCPSNTSELLDVLKKFDELPQEIKEFAHRVRILREAYACLREAVLTKVTFLTSTSDLLKRSVQREREIDECVDKLSAWAKRAAQGESWRDIYDKIVEIRNVIKNEQEQLRVISQEKLEKEQERRTH